ncbi:hypothetical protein RF819_07760 [Rhodoferax fermentans]|uniref:Glycosyl transferase n=1 Tax=Rhodoferax fermentans TaxID=28066 RepID=A0A1T1AXW4_RHOFE|nr:hypothetical protein RF819_07760 [Rhodoferax fermentans]
MLHINHSDSGGGAARAALRLHLALDAAGFDSSMLLRQVRTKAPYLFGPRSPIGAALSQLRSPVGRAVMRLQGSSRRAPRSGNFLPSDWASRIESIAPDVVNLHWIGAETMSIEDVARIKRPIVWTLHDMWAFCGSEHVEPDETRWAQGYTRNNRRIEDMGLDLDRGVWLRKKKAWRLPMRIIAPSKWMADCVNRSALMSESPVSVIPNVLDTECYCPLDRVKCRSELGLPQDKVLVLFGAIQGSSDPNKGYDLLKEALGHCKTFAESFNVECVVFGQKEPTIDRSLPVRTHWLGHIDHEATLARIYSAADVMVVPSRIENLPQTATEAQACGCPVVAFRVSGLKEVVDDRITGYLADPYDARDLYQGIRWVTDNSCQLSSLRRSARDRAVRLWHARVVVPEYVQQYQLAIEDVARVKTRRSQ